MNTGITVKVTYRAGAYNTNAVGGQRASSTMDAATAVERLGQKLLGTSYYGATLVEDTGPGTSVWEIQSQPAGTAQDVVQIGPTDI